MREDKWLEGGFGVFFLIITRLLKTKKLHSLSVTIMFPSPDQSSITVLPTGTDVKEAQVICVSTGTKCINGEYMSDRGLALNDCHAEIIARRSLIRYLYTQLEFFLRSVDSLRLFSSVTIQAFKVFLS